MSLKSLKKVYIKRYWEGFTLIELIVGTVIASIAASAIFIGVTYIQSSYNKIRLKERAYEELKSYTELQKVRIAAGVISTSATSETKGVCLDLTEREHTDADCVNKATIYATFNIIGGDHIYVPPGSVPENSKAQRHGLKTRIVWETTQGATQELSFYVEQMVFN